MIRAGSKRDQRGVTLTELMISIFISLIVVMALGRLVMLNSESFTSSSDRTDLQQSTSFVLERMAKAVRQAHGLQVNNSRSFNTLDAGGGLAAAFQRASSSGTPRIQMNGMDLAGYECTFFNVIADADTTSLILEIELTGDDGVSNRTLTRVAQRNVE